MNPQKLRKDASTPEDSIKTAARLPWWALVGLAIGSFVMVQSLASGATYRTHEISSSIWYVVVLAFLASAIIGRRKSRGRRRWNSGARDSSHNERPSPPPTEIRPDKWSIELLRKIDWKRFEEVCADYFRVCGFHATTQSHGPDGGVDIKLYALNDKTRIVSIVQCKQWSNMIGPKPLRELLGVMTATKVSRGVFVTSSFFNDEAKTLATENRIHLLNGLEFLNGILGRSNADQSRLLQVATEGDYLTPTCPSCGIKLIARKRKRDSSSFWGCANYPKCRITLAA